MIYDRPIRELMKDAAELAPPYTAAEIVEWFGQHYPRVNPNSVRAHIIGLTANHPSRHHYHLGGMTALFVRQPDKTLLPFDPTDATGVDDGEIADGADGDDETLPEQSAEFVLEAHLEDFLAANWAAIGWGRQLEIWQSPDGQSGHQLATLVGRMNFLCADRNSGALVVIELKRGRPSDKVVG